MKKKKIKYKRIINYLKTSAKQEIKNSIKQRFENGHKANMKSMQNQTN